MPELPYLSVIIVNWNSVEVLRACLTSLYGNTKDLNFEVLVIDNASFDGSEQMVEREFPSVIFIQSQNNLGFARANNLAFTYSKGSVLLFLNPDTEVVGSAVMQMIACLDSVENAGVVGPKLLNSDSSIQTSCVRAFPSILNRVLDSEYLRNKYRRSSLWGNRVLFDEPLNATRVEAISGACLMIRRSVFEKVQQFDSGYFMYAEDTDLCYRVQKVGWKNYYVGEAVVIHHGGQSSSSHPVNQFSSLMMKESTFKFFRQHHGVVYAQLFRIAMGLTALARMAVAAIAILPTSSKQQKLVGSITFDKWKGVLRWAIGLEQWVKRFTKTEAMNR